MNKLYDSKLGPLGYSYDLFHYNETIKPIWVANQLAGKYSGCMMWPGNDFEYTGINCTFSLTFNAKEPWIKRVDTALSWFTHPKTPANLVMLYIEEPDAMAHVFGPESDVVSEEKKSITSARYLALSEIGSNVALFIDKACLPR